MRQKFQGAQFIIAKRHGNFQLVKRYAGIFSNVMQQRDDYRRNIFADVRRNDQRVIDVLNASFINLPPY